MRVKGSIVLIHLLVFQCAAILCSSQGFDFFYFVQNWYGSICDDGKRSCCLPTTGKPDEDFGIHGLWPNYNNGSFPKNCIRQSSLDKSQISDLLSRMQKDWPTLSCPSADGVKFWNHEWKKHGTCSGLDQHTYFQAALDFKDKSNLLQLLKDAGISPGDFYSTESIKQAIKSGIGYEPVLDCNVDLAGNSQLFQVYLCVDISASTFIDCPVVPVFTNERACNSTIEFPSFSSASGSLADL